MDKSIKPTSSKVVPAGEIRPEQWIEFCLQQMALAMGEWLQQNNDLDKPVSKLTLRELKGMSWAAMAKYTDLREIERERHKISLLDGKSLDDLGLSIRDNNAGTS